MSGPNQGSAAKDPLLTAEPHHEPNPVAKPDTSQDEIFARQLQAEEQSSANPSVPPAHPTSVVGSPAERFRHDDVWHDISFMILFFVVWVVSLICCVVALSEHGGKFPKQMNLSGTRDVVCWVLLPVLAAVTGGVFVMLAIHLLRRWPLKVVNVVLVCQIVFLSTVTAIFLLLGHLYNGIILLLITILYCLWLFLIRRMIPFAAALLEIAGAITKQYPGMIILSLTSLLPQVALLALTLCALLGISRAIEDEQDGANDDDAKSAQYGGLVLMIGFGWFWSSQVIRNVVHMACASVSATWYFQLPRLNPTILGLQRACTKSFGSVCMGSLFVALVQMLRFFVWQQQQDSFLALCLDCLLACIEHILRLINKYAFTYIALYGESFCDAAGMVWDILKERGFDLIINNDITVNVFWMLGITIGVVTSIITALLGLMLQVSSIGLLAITGGAVGFVVAMLGLAPLDSAVATMFVAFAEDPAQLGLVSHELNAKLQAAWMEGFGEGDWEVRMRTTQAPVYRAHPV
eukprot:TRINITY_DN20103_c0_g1_i1.p1 TRINITY_DN20103_c0_g1~~TRINITY_DN20103_c0_g1_i1.p1  ORF type:complete len:520 (-),score=127.91 TRINITY_DN20103_c0_g1_i1:137-1696(-)